MRINRPVSEESALADGFYCGSCIPRCSVEGIQIEGKRFLPVGSALNYSNTYSARGTQRITRSFHKCESNWQLQQLGYRIESPNGLIMSESRDATAIDNLEDTSFDFDGGVSRLIE
jgi:hypothetical protein